MSFLRLSFLSLLAPCLLAQSPDTPIFEQNDAAISKYQEEVIQKAQVVREKVSAINKAEIDKQILAPLPEPIKLPPALTKELSPEDIAEHARKSNLRVGYCYKCMSCENWHINLAGGYAIAPNVITTCDHILATKTKMRDGFIVAVDHAGNIACGVAVLAHNATMDVAIIKVDGAEFTPVPLNANVEQGSLSYCFSYPLKQQGYFSAGIINRFYWHSRYQNQDKNTIDALSYLRVNYSNDWAPGSSGSPLFDSAGNVTGHVSTISGLTGGKDKSSMITLHEGIPARAVQALVAALDKPKEIARLATFTDIIAKTPVTIDKPSKENPEAEEKPHTEEKPDTDEKPETEESKNTDLLAKGLDGWTFITKEGEQPAAPTWKIEDGVLSTTGSPIGYLRTKETFKSYTLTFEWRWQPNTEKNNSGVLVHVSTPNPTGAWPKSFEAQLEQGNAGDFWCIGETLTGRGESPNNGKRWLRTVDPKEKTLGEWNTMTVTCTEDSIEVQVNGVLTNQGKSLSAKEGAIAFQVEGSLIEFRNILVTE